VIDVAVERMVAINDLVVGNAEGNSETDTHGNSAAPRKGEGEARWFPRMPLPARGREDLFYAACSRY
jgi:hypothetical protein